MAHSQSMLSQEKVIFGVPVAVAKTNRFVMAPIRERNSRRLNMRRKNQNECFSVAVK